MTNSQSTRRGFLGGAIAAASLAGSTTTSAATKPTGDLKLGVATYSLRKFSRTDAIRMIRELGVSYASVKEMHLPYRSTPEELAAGIKEFEQGDVTIAGGGVIYLQKDDDEDIKKYFDYAHACKMPMMTIGPIQENLRRIEKFVKEYDIKVAIHNHGPEDKHFPSPEVALKALKGMDARMGVCVDVGHTVRTGTSAVASIRAAGARLLDLHIKDLRDLKDGKTQVPVGDGAMPVADIFRELKRMRYQGCVNLEYEINGDNPMPGMMKSFAFMRGALAGLRA